MNRSRYYFSALLCLLSLASGAQRRLDVMASRPVSDVSPTMWGIFFEDINFGADGGLYAELVKNRSFEFAAPLMGWKELRQGAEGRVLIVNSGTKVRYAQVKAAAPSGVYALVNEGFRGMGFQKGEVYQFSIKVKKNSGDLKLNLSLLNSAGQPIGSAKIETLPAAWESKTVSITATDSASKGRLMVAFEGSGAVDIDMVSLFPQHTWKNRPKGLRPDLVQLLADMKPNFIRFPGGCIVEGRDLNNRYQWKATVGKVEYRVTEVNRWNTEFRHRPAPDYYQSFGLGFFEYFQLAEDVGAEPLPILNCGMACQFNSSEVVAMNALDPYVQDALDLVEFANGAVSTKWGKLRASMGHPKPFGLKFLGVGNEQWDEQYIERYKEFEKVLKSRYPQIKLVAAAGASPDGKMFDYAWGELKKLKADLVDEHYYKAPDWFLKNASRYDNYDRKGPKVFAGEYAAQSHGIASTENRNSWECALSEAAFMTGLERNGDVVRMASYAPLFAHVDAWQWSPDLIWFDNLRSYGTPNYYVQKLFSVNKGTTVVPLLEGGAAVAGKDSLFGSSVTDANRGEVIVKLVNAGSAPIPVELNVDGYTVNGGAMIETIASERGAVNSLDQPTAVSPVTTTITGERLVCTLPPLSFSVIRIPVSGMKQEKAKPQAMRN